MTDNPFTGSRAERNRQHQTRSRALPVLESLRRAGRGPVHPVIDCVAELLFASKATFGGLGGDRSEHLRAQSALPDRPRVGEPSEDSD